MARQVYYETLFQGLVPVEEPVAVGRSDLTGALRYRARVTKTTGPFRKGEDVFAPARGFVHKERTCADGFIRVSQWKPQA